MNISFNRMLLLSFCLALLKTEAVAQGRVDYNRTIALESLETPLDYSIYLPEAYCNNEGAPYPVLYLLHGYGGGHHDWPKVGNITSTLDRLITDQIIPPLIVIMPAAAKSWYVNSPKHGNYETAILYELPEAIEAEFPVQANKGGRVVAGLSMGGYGALRMAYLEPDRFAAVAALSPAIFPNATGDDDFRPIQIKLFSGVFGDPFIVEKFNQKNIFSLIENTPNPPATFLTVGDDDSFGLYDGTYAFYKLMREQKKPVELRVTDGNHSWKLWSREIETALLFLSKKLERQDSSSFASEKPLDPFCL
ncbi:alpha/beta hydrolase family protein [Kiloniella laminariae]|uniref:Alpha/beta hydrolase family protein n=1 Tax=Kiloniella laminariae TaxID=454162 RepID=A0ABT4LPB1_9PROT|nr:alpha/beta hydrolase family protein [Kiloniella laminariae]MCZ4282735.1 alpha/beta hydrolase family protein [Kiloniella laminariae]